MEDIEYLEEYEDLILPTIKSNSGQVTYSARSGNNSTTNMMQDEDSSSIDQDIFESLFDDHSDDDSTVLQKKVDPKLSQRRLDDRASLDSLDMLVKDLVGEQNRSQANASTSGSGPSSKGYSQLSKKITSTPNRQTAAGRGLQKASTSKASPLLKGRPVPPTKTSNSGQSSKAPIGDRSTIHHQFPKRISTAESTIIANRPKSKPISSKSSNRPDTTKYDKLKSIATVRPTVQQQQSNRFPSGNANRSIVSSSSPRPSSSSNVARKQMPTALQKNKNETLTPIRRPVQRPPTTIVKPEKREIKDPSEDPLSLDDIAEALLDSDSDSFSLSDISDDALESLSDFEEDPNNVIDISNDSSIDGKISHKDLDNIRAATPSPTVSEDRDDITLSPSPPQMKTKVNRCEKVKRPIDMKKPAVAGGMVDVDLTPSTSIKRVPEKVTILSDTLLSRIDTALLATAVVDGPPNKIIEKTNAPVLSPREISSAADICTNAIVSLTDNTTNENIIDEFHEAADFIEEHIIEHEEIAAEELKEDLQITSIITDEVVVANEDKNELNLFVDGQLDVDQQKENIEVAMEVEIETNEDIENPTEVIEDTIFDDTVVEENMEECEDMTELIEECDEDESEATEKDKITENTETQVEANKIENLEEVKSEHLNRKRKADAVTSTSLESTDVIKKDFKEPLNPRENILSKEEAMKVESSTLSKRLPSAEKSEEASPTVPTKKAKLDVRTRRRFRNLEDSDKATDTSESEIETLTSSQHHRRPKVPKMSQAVGSKDDNKITQKISNNHQKESETETETETGVQHHNASVSGCTNKSKQSENLRNSSNNSENNKSAEESKKTEATVEKTKQNIKHQKEDIILKPVPAKEMHSKTPTLRKSSRSRSSQASDSNDTEDEKHVKNLKGPAPKVESTEDETKLKSKPEKVNVATSKGKDITEDDKSLSSEIEERNNKITKELLQNVGEKLKSIETTANVETNAEATHTIETSAKDMHDLPEDINKAETKTPTIMSVRVKRIEEKHLHKILGEETQEPTVSSTISEDNLRIANETTDVNAKEISIESTSSEQYRKTEESLQINEIAKPNDEQDANTPLETKATDESDLKSTEKKEKESNENETVQKDVLHNTRKSVKSKDAQHTCETENMGNNERSKSVAQKSSHTTSVSSRTADTVNDASKVDNKERGKESKELNEKSEHTSQSASKTNEAGIIISNDDCKSSEKSNVTPQKEENPRRSAGRSKGSKDRLYTDQKGQHSTRSTLKIKEDKMVVTNDDNKTNEDINISDPKKEQIKTSPVTSKEDKKSEETKASDKKIELTVKSDVKTKQSDKLINYDKKSLEEIIGCQKSVQTKMSIITAKELDPPVGGNEDKKTPDECKATDKKIESEKGVSKEIFIIDRKIEGTHKVHNNKDASMEVNVDDQKVEKDKTVRDATIHESKHATRSANKTKERDRTKEVEKKNLSESTDKLSQRESRIQTPSTARSPSTTKSNTKIKPREVENVVASSENTKTISLSPLPTRKSIRSNVTEKDAKIVETIDEKQNISLTNKTPDKAQLKQKAAEEDCTYVGHTHGTRRTVKSKAEDKQNSIEIRTTSPSSLPTRNATKAIEEHVGVKSLTSEGVQLREKTVVDSKTPKKEISSKSVKGAEEEKPSEKNTNRNEEKAGKSNIKSPPKTNFIVRRNYKNQAISQRPEEYANAILTKSGMSLKEWQEAQKAKSGEKTACPEKKPCDLLQSNSGQGNKSVVSPAKSPVKPKITTDKKIEKVNATEKKIEKVNATEKKIEKVNVKETTKANPEVLANTSKGKLPNVNVKKEASFKKSDKPIAKTTDLSKSVSSDSLNESLNKKSDKPIDKTNICKPFSVKLIKQTINEKLDECIPKQTTNEKLDDCIPNSHNVSETLPADLPKESFDTNSDTSIKIMQSTVLPTTSVKTRSSKDSIKESLGDKRKISNDKKETSNDKKDSLKDKNVSLEDDKETLSDKKGILSEKNKTFSDKKEILSQKNETVNDEKETSSEKKEILIDKKKATQIKAIESLVEKEKPGEKLEKEGTNQISSKKAIEEAPKNIEIEKIGRMEEVKGNEAATPSCIVNSFETVTTRSKTGNVGKNSSNVKPPTKEDAESAILNEMQNNVNSSSVAVVEQSSDIKSQKTSVSECTDKAKDQHDIDSISENIKSTENAQSDDICPELEISNAPKQQLEKDKITTREIKGSKSTCPESEISNEPKQHLERDKITTREIKDDKNTCRELDISNEPKQQLEKDRITTREIKGDKSTCPELEILNEPKQQLEKDKITTSEIKDDKSTCPELDISNEPKQQLEKDTITTRKIKDSKSACPDLEISNEPKQQLEKDTITTRKIKDGKSTCPDLETSNEPKPQLEKDTITTRETKDDKSIVEPDKVVNESTTKTEHTEVTKTKLKENQNLKSVEKTTNTLDTNKKLCVEIQNKTIEKTVITPIIESNPMVSQITPDKISADSNAAASHKSLNNTDVSINSNDEITSPSPRRKAKVKSEIEMLMESLPKGLELNSDDSKRRRRQLPLGRKHSNLDDSKPSVIFKTPTEPVTSLSMISTPVRNPFAGDIGLPHITRSIVRADKSIKLASWKSRIMLGKRPSRSRKRSSTTTAEKSTKSIREKSKRISDKIPKIPELVLTDSPAKIVHEKNSKAVLEVSTTSTSEIPKKSSDDIPKVAEISGESDKPIADESSRNKTDMIGTSSKNCVSTENKSASIVPVHSFKCRKLRVRLNRSIVRNYWIKLKKSKTTVMHPTTISKLSTENVRSSSKSRTPTEQANSLASLLLKALSAPSVSPSTPLPTVKPFATPTMADSSKALSTQQQFYSTVTTRAKVSTMSQKSHPPVSLNSTTQQDKPMEAVTLNTSNNKSHEMTMATTNNDSHCDESFLLTPLKTVGPAQSVLRQQTQQQQQPQQQKRSARLQQLTQKQIAQESIPATPTQSTKAQLAPTSNLQQPITQINFSPVVPKKEIDDEQTSATVAVQSLSALMSGGLPAVVVDNSGTRLYSFLHPAKYNRSHGAVLLDYCCPNLNGPMPAIDPTRDHSQVQTLVRELPAYIAMTTTVITRADLEDKNNSIPASIRKKYLATCPARPPAISMATETSQAPPLNASTALQPSSHMASIGPLAAFTPSITALQKQLPSTTTLTAKMLPLSLPVSTSSTECLPTLTPFSAMASSNVVASETVANAPPLTPFSVMNSSNAAASEIAAGAPPKLWQSTDFQRYNSLRTNMRRFDTIIKKYSPRICTLTYSERQRITESVISHTKLSPKDIENATSLLDDYCQKIVNLVPQKPVSYVATPTINTATHTTAPTTSNIGSNFSSPIPAIVQSSPTPSSSSSTAATQKLEQMHASAVQKVKTSGSSTALQRQVPIYDKDRNIIGYQMHVTPGTGSAISQRAGIMSSKQTTTPSPSSTVKRSSIGATTPATTLKQPAQQSPRIFYTKPVQTSTPISAASTALEAAARLGRSVTIRHIAAKNLTPPRTPQTPPSINVSGGIMSKHLPKVTVGNIKTTHSLTSSSFTPPSAITATTCQRVTRHAATNKSEQIVIITKDKDGSIQTTNNPDECILPDEESSGAEHTEIKREREDDLLTGGG